jgi:hypothetical protein
MGYQPRPLPTPRPSNGAGYCRGCGRHAALNRKDRCRRCEWRASPNHTYKPREGPAIWGDALPESFRPPGVR